MHQRICTPTTVRNSCRTLLKWIVNQGIGTALIEPGKPWPNWRQRELQRNHPVEAADQERRAHLDASFRNRGWRAWRLQRRAKRCQVYGVSMVRQWPAAATSNLAHPMAMHDLTNMVSGAKVPIPSFSSPSTPGYYVYPGYTPSLSDIFAVMLSPASGDITPVRGSSGGPIRGSPAAAQAASFNPPCVKNQNLALRSSEPFVGIS